MSLPPEDQRRVLMLVMSDVVHDARVRREAGSLAGAGYEVGVIGLGHPARSRLDGCDLVRLGRRTPDAGRRHGIAGRMLRWWLLPLHRSRVEATFRRAAVIEGVERGADVIHAHDLNTLKAGAELARRLRARLVYDAHECWAGRPQVGRPDPTRRRRLARLEKRLSRRADAVIASGPGVARWLQHDQGLGRVAVVRNTFDNKHPTKGSTPDRPVRLVYAGRIGPGRDLETLVTAADGLPIAPLLIGNVAPGFRGAGALDVRPPVGIAELAPLLRSGGLALVSLEDSCLNHRLALPNKLFHAVHAGIPVVAADLPEISRMVRQHGLGTLYKPGEPKSLIEAVELAVEGYGALVESVARARPALSWQVDEPTLLDLYTRLVSRSPPESPA